MHYDQSWMGYGIVGGMQAGAISFGVAFALLWLLRWLSRQQPWSHARLLAVSCLLALVPTATGDLWDLLYFNYAGLQSPLLLRAKLAGVHDPDSIGLRVLCECLGALTGSIVAWLLVLWRDSRRGDNGST